MEERSNKTIISSVLFLDIVEYSKKSVTGQISLKDRFNTYLSEAIHDVPVVDRIILDTGDGAAVNFMGDVEAALSAALRLRASLLAEDPYVEPPLLVRIGINLGPVRLVRDINGQPNIVGDGINVAQRVMAFAEASQILVSRSYYDAVSRLSAEYTGMFHYQGSRTDKHVREHEIYAIGYPGDQTTKRMVLEDDESQNVSPTLFSRAKKVLFSSVAKPGAWSEKVKEASAKQRALYAGMVVLPLFLLTAMLMRGPTPTKTEPVKPMIETMPTASAVVVVPTVADKPAPKTTDEVKPEAVVVKETNNKSAQDKNGHDKHKPDPVIKKVVATGKASDTQSKPDVSKKSANDAANLTPEVPRETHLSVTCKEGTQVFVDGTQKGKMSADSMVLTIKPGKHKVILTHPSFGLYNEEIDADAGKTERVKPKVCN